MPSRLEAAPRCAHFLHMKYLAVVALACLAGGACAAEPEIHATKPYLFAPPPERLDPVERGRAELQRDRLDSALRSLDRRSDLGKLDGFGRRDRLELRGEAQRFDRLLGPPRR
jgi:hypothetical protein